MYYPVLQRTTPVLLWNVIYNARSKQSEPRTSPTTAPATQSESHAWSMSHMKRHLQCAKQQEPPSNLTKYCACHEIRSSWFQRKIPELLPPIERRFEDNPNISDDKIVISHPPLRRPSPCDLGDNFVLKNTTCRAPAISQNVTKCCACHEKSHSSFTKYCACHTKWIAPQCSASHMKCHFQCAEQVKSPANLTKYCPCHRKSMSAGMCVAYETSFPVRRANKITLQPPQILRLPRNLYSKWRSSAICDTYETSFPMRGANKATLQPHQILRLPRNSEFRVAAQNPWIASANIKTIRG